MTPKQLEKLAHTMFPQIWNWKSAMAKVLGYNRATINRWLDGTVEIDEGREAQVLDVAESQYKRLGELLQKHGRL